MCSRLRNVASTHMYRKCKSYKQVSEFLKCGRWRADAGLPLVSIYHHMDKNSLLMSVASIVPWQQCHISMETQPYICFRFNLVMWLQLLVGRYASTEMIYCHTELCPQEPLHTWPLCEEAFCCWTKHIILSMFVCQQHIAWSIWIFVFWKD